MMRKKRKHMKIRPVESKNLVALKKEREITIADMPPRGPQALENQVVGLFQKGGDNGVVLPDPGYAMATYGQILIRKNQQNGAPFGMKVVCEIINPSARKGDYEGRIIEVLGDPGNNDVAMLSILRQFGLPSEFPLGVQDEVADLPLSPTDAAIEEALLQAEKIFGT